MRILLAVDGSVSSDRATELVSTFTLPPDSLVRVVAVHRPSTGRAGHQLGGAWATPGRTSRRMTGTRPATCARPSPARRSPSAAPTSTIEGFLLHGRAGSSIVDEARAMEADLVVVGSRGHGTIATMLLGSTASEVVDHAPCPVLVARRSHLAPLVFADDGSRSARHAETVFAEWPILAGTARSAS